MKIDCRKSYYLMVDTETCNSFVDEKGKLNLDDSLVYDVGFAIIDKKGNIYEQYSCTLGEIYYNLTDAMQSCYYAAKLPQYEKEMHNKERLCCNMWEIRKMIFALCEKYNVKAIVAHNARFDVRSLNNTIRYVTKSKVRYFLPYEIDIWDTLKMCKVISQQKSYKEFCLENGYMTKHKTPRPRQTAEVLYRYISGDNTFEEKHTGLEDVKIEVQIFAHCMKQHKKMDKVLYSNRIA